MATKLAALVGIPVLLLAGYVYWYGDPTVGYRCKWAARERFSQIILDNSRSFQGEILAALPMFELFVSHLAGSACACVEKKISHSNSMPRDLALQQCIAEIRSNPYKLDSY